MFWSITTAIAHRARTETPNKYTKIFHFWSFTSPNFETETRREKVQPQSQPQPPFNTRNPFSVSVRESLALIGLHLSNAFIFQMVCWMTLRYIGLARFAKTFTIFRRTFLATVIWRCRPTSSPSTFPLTPGEGLLYFGGLVSKREPTGVSGAIITPLPKFFVYRFALIFEVCYYYCRRGL